MSTTVETPSPVTVPDEDTTLALVEAALQAGVAPADLTPADVLSLPQDVIDAARDTSGETAPLPLGRAWTRELSYWRRARTTQRDSALIAAPRRAPEALTNALGAEAERRGVCIAFHCDDQFSLTGTHRDELMSIMPSGWVNVVVRSHIPGEHLRLGRVTVAADADVRTAPPDGWQVVRVRDEVVAGVRVRPNGGMTLWLWVNPFQGRGSGATPAGLSGRQMDVRMALLGEILDAAGDVIGEHAWRRQAPDATTEAIRRAVAVVQGVRGMALSHAARQQHALQDAQRRQQQAQTQIDRTRTQLIELIREAEEQAQLAATLAAALPAQQAIAATEAMTTLNRIKALGPVRDCAVIEDRGEFYLRVALYPYVFTPAGGRGARRLLEHLTYRVRIDGGSDIQWEPSFTASPHPHVSTSGATCWGNAHVPVAEAFGRRDWLTLTVLVTGWITQHNPRSEYTALTNFPTTDLPGGWLLPTETTETH